MKKLSIDVDDEIKDYFLPENWDEVKLSDFITLFSVDKTNLNPLEISVKTIEILLKIDEEILMMMNANDFETLAKELEFTTKDVEPVNIDFIELEGEKYYIKSNFNQLTMGEVISIETILEDGDNNIFKVMDKLLCIFLRKKKENGKLETFKGEFMERQELFRNAPVSKVYNIFNFFLSGGNSLEVNTQDYLENPPTNQ
jgi:hypothetical protein